MPIWASGSEGDFRACFYCRLRVQVSLPSRIQLVAIRPSDELQTEVLQLLRWLVLCTGCVKLRPMSEDLGTSRTAAHSEAVPSQLSPTHLLAMPHRAEPAGTGGMPPPGRPHRAGYRSIHGAV